MNTVRDLEFRLCGKGAEHIGGTAKRAGNRYFLLKVVKNI